MEQIKNENLGTEVRNILKQVASGLAIIAVVGGLAYICHGCYNVNGIDNPNIVCSINMNGKVWNYEEREPYEVNRYHKWIAEILGKKTGGYVRTTDENGNAITYDLNDPKIQKFRLIVRELYDGLENNNNN